MKKYLIIVFLILSVAIFSQDRQLNMITITDLVTNASQKFMFYYEESLLIQVNSVVFSEYPPLWQTTLFDYDSFILSSVTSSGPWIYRKMHGIKYTDNTINYTFEQLHKESGPVTEERQFLTNSDKSIILWNEYFLLPNGKCVSKIQYLLSNNHKDLILKYSISSAIESESITKWISPTTANVVEGSSVLYKIEKISESKNDLEYHLLETAENGSGNLLKIHIQYEDNKGNIHFVF